ncbi:hypothetical protein HRI_000409100 [Hibiscus trionum]|uniref:NAC domain-containing protein n=1 Tax=Hibiscus trionum TaxID=183268 RepID=A0A9W7LJT3_HIBTR|nr:hypothetical protein HRI_000409100 [Hibiscus trionum]
MDAESKNDVDKVEDVMLPGFRFHPTDEELVGFYLKKKIQQKSLPIELIKQLDIYKYEPWDLPKLAASGEKEWYFYCPRDRKYRNSARPNRVTRAGFWKATGTDRPIHTSDGTQCIGLKKSLVFYRGRAAKGTKTDWMMHEFRLPSLSDKTLSANDSWAICRIFRKNNSMAQRALCHTFIPSLSSDIIHNVDDSSTALSPRELMVAGEITNNSGSIDFEGKQRHFNGFSISLPQDLQGTGKTSNEALEESNWRSIRPMGFPFSLSPNELDSRNSPQCPSEISTTYSTHKCYT